MCKAISAGQLMEAVDIKLRSLSKSTPCISSTSELADWWRWLSLQGCQGVTFWRHPAKMEGLEPVSAIAQMLTAGDMPSPQRTHPSSETFWEIGSTVCQMEQDYDTLSFLTACTGYKRCDHKYSPVCIQMNIKRTSLPLFGSYSRKIYHLSPVSFDVVNIQRKS